MTQGLVVEFTFACSLFSGLNLLLLLLVCLPLLPHSRSFLLSLSSFRAFRCCIGIFVVSERFHTSWQQRFRGDVARTRWAFYHYFRVGVFVLHHNVRHYIEHQKLSKCQGLFSITEDMDVAHGCGEAVVGQISSISAEVGKICQAVIAHCSGVEIYALLLRT